MVAVEFGHTSNPDKSGFGSNQRLLNGYAEALGQSAKSPLPIYGVPGTSRFDIGTTGLNGPCRGMLYVYGKGLYVIAGTAAALLDDQGNATPVSGTVAGASMVIMAANQQTNPQIGIVADNVYYVLDTGTNTISEPTIASLPAPNSVTFLDGYLVFSIPDGRIFHTALNDALTVNALSYATASSRSDGLRRIVTHRGALIALGEFEPRNLGRRRHHTFCLRTHPRRYRHRLHRRANGGDGRRRPDVGRSERHGTAARGFRARPNFDACTRARHLGPYVGRAPRASRHLHPFQRPRFLRRDKPILDVGV